jgi:hypothetical protein
MLCYIIIIIIVVVVVVIIIIIIGHCIICPVKKSSLYHMIIVN